MRQVTIEFLMMVKEIPEGEACKRLDTYIAKYKNLTTDEAITKVFNALYHCIYEDVCSVLTPEERRDAEARAKEKTAQWERDNP